MYVQEQIFFIYTSYGSLITTSDMEHGCLISDMEVIPKSVTIC